MSEWFCNCLQIPEKYSIIVIQRRSLCTSSFICSFFFKINIYTKRLASKQMDYKFLFRFRRQFILKIIKKKNKKKKFKLWWRKNACINEKYLHFTNDKVVWSQFSIDNMKASKLLGASLYHVTSIADLIFWTKNTSSHS